MGLVWFHREIPDWLIGVAQSLGAGVTAFDPRSITTRGQPVVAVVDARAGDALATCRNARAGFGPGVVVTALTGAEPLSAEALAEIDLEVPASSLLAKPVLRAALLLAKERHRARLLERRLAQAERRAHGPDLAAEQTEREYRQLLEGLPDAVLVEQGGKVVFANRTAAAMLGCSIDALLESSFLDRVYSDDRAAVESQVFAVEAQRTPALHEARMVRPDGSLLMVELRSLLVVFDGQPATFIVARDVSERKRVQGLMAASDRLASMGALSAGVAHEINNPLTALVSSLDFIDEEAENHPELAASAELGDLLLTAKEASHRIRDIIRDLRLFARPDEEHRGLVDLRATLDSTCRLARVEIRHRARLLKTFGAIPMVDGNEARLGQVFLNLMMNAAQAINEGAIEANEIELTTREDADGNAVVEVRDTGRGISPQVLDRVFEPFFTTKPVGVGTGLGLPISRGIVESMGGSMAIESELGRGTLVRVVLPRAVRRPTPRSARPAARENASRPRGRVLVVDDDVAVRRALIRILGVDHEVTTVSSGAECIETILSGERFDVVLCDLMMPRVTGDQCYRRVVEIAADQAERFVFMTGGAFTPGARAFLETMPHPLLEKPFDIEQLRQVVRVTVDGLAPNP